jgi:hypothetical protein
MIAPIPRAIRFHFPSVLFRLLSESAAWAKRELRDFLLNKLIWVALI